MMGIKKASLWRSDSAVSWPDAKYLKKKRKEKKDSKFQQAQRKTINPDRKEIQSTTFLKNTEVLM